MEVIFEDVSYTYDNKSSMSKKALSRVSVKFKKAKINAIVGKSGSGKTTLVQLTNALIIPTKGKIIVDKYIVQKDFKIPNINDLRINVGLVFQFPEDQIFNSTVKKEISFGMKYFNYKVNQLDKRCKDALTMVGLDQAYLERSPFTLSHGEIRKVAIASILVFNPKVLILDEPTIGLDSESKNSLIRLLKLLKERYKKTIIIISHDTDMIHKIADYVVVMSNGKVVMEGDKYKVFKDEQSLKKYGIRAPRIIEFSNLVKNKKNIRLGYRDDINDLIKDVYRNVK